MKKMKLFTIDGHGAVFRLQVHNKIRKKKYTLLDKSKIISTNSCESDIIGKVATRNYISNTSNKFHNLLKS